MQQGEQGAFACADGAGSAPPHVYWTDGCVVVELHGEVDVSAYQRAAPVLDPIAAGSVPTVIVDLRHTTFFDCSGIALLLRARRGVTGRGGRLRVVCDHPLTLRMMGVTGLLPVLKPVPTLRAALEAA